MGSLAILGSRGFLGYNDVLQIICGYLLGSVAGTLVFSFINTTTLKKASIKAGFNPLWIKIGLKNNMADMYLEQCTMQQRIMIQRLRQKYEPIRRTREEMENNYIKLKQATQPLLSSANSPSFDILKQFC